MDIDEDRNIGQAPSTPIKESRFDAFTVLRMALDTLNQRAYKWACLVMTFGLYAACVYRPSWVRAALAGGFTLSVYLLTSLLDRRQRR